MKQAKAHSQALTVVMEAEVVRYIRQHARSSPKSEVCGVLIGREEGSTTRVDACIEGVNAAQGGAHVTFTQETWEHIYKVKDERYPDARIVGWYHSHPGFGVFLSDHDLFIQENFFSSPQQIAWVYDPHSDEEGCFGWHNGKIEKVDHVQLRFVAPVGELREDLEQDEVSRKAPPPAREARTKNWSEYAFTVVSYIVVFMFGAMALRWYIEPGLNQALVQAYEEGLRKSVVRDCGRLFGMPDPAQPPATQPQEKPNGAKR
jgi:proteasome lid subunit RPN8/RPN11